MFDRFLNTIIDVWGGLHNVFEVFQSMKKIICIFFLSVKMPYEILWVNRVFEKKNQMNQGCYIMEIFWIEKN